MTNLKHLNCDNSNCDNSKIEILIKLKNSCFVLKKNKLNKDNSKFVTKLKYLNYEQSWKLNLSRKNPIHGRQRIPDRCRKQHQYHKNLAANEKFPVNKKKLRSNFTPFMSKSFQIWDYFIPLLFHKDSKNLKTFWHWILGNLGKKTFKWS